MVPLHPVYPFGRLPFRSAILFAGLTLGCKGDAPVRTDTGEVNDTQDTSSSPVLNLEVRDSEMNPLARLIDVTLSQPGRLRVEFWSAGAPRLETEATESSTRHSVPLIGLRADSETTAVVHVDFDSGESLTSEPVEITTVPLDFESPVFNILVPMEDDGVVTILGLAQDLGATIPSSFVGISRTGELVWIGRSGETTAGASFLEPVADGTFLNYYPSASQGSSRTYDLLSPTSDTVSQIQSPYSMHHDGAPLPNGNLVSMHRVRRTVEVSGHGEVQLTGDAIAEVTPSGEALWEWNSFDYLDTNRFPVGTSQIKGGDWTHGNTLDYLPETNELLAGFRNQNQVLTIDRDTQEITRTFGKDGDYTLTSGAWFQGQHQASIHSEEVLTVFDNHYPKVPGLQTRIVEYRFDDTQKTAEQIWSYDLGYFYRSGGEATVLENGNLRVSAGGANRDDDAPIQLIEFDKNRTVIWHVEVPTDAIPMIFRSSQIRAGTPVDP